MASSAQCVSCQRKTTDVDSGNNPCCLSCFTNKCYWCPNETCLNILPFGWVGVCEKCNETGGSHLPDMIVVEEQTSIWWDLYKHIHNRRPIPHPYKVKFFDKTRVIDVAYEVEHEQYSGYWSDQYNNRTEYKTIVCTLPYLKDNISSRHSLYWRRSVYIEFVPESLPEYTKIDSQVRLKTDPRDPRFDEYKKIKTKRVYEADHTRCDRCNPCTCEGYTSYSDNDDSD